MDSTIIYFEKLQSKDKQTRYKAFQRLQTMTVKKWTGLMKCGILY
ncbi:hypothetical protein [Pontibacillus yanchengensis]